MEFVFVADVGPDLAADGVDGGGVELAGCFGQGAVEAGGAGAALFEAGFVEVGEGVGVEELVGELRGGGSVDGEAADGSGFDAA